MIRYETRAGIVRMGVPPGGICVGPAGSWPAAGEGGA